MRGVAIGCLIFAVGCSSAPRDDDGDIDLSSVVGDWDTELTPRAGSGVRGSAAAQSAAVGLGARIRVEAAAAGAVHPWHIHTGTCSTSGPVLGRASDYPAITVGSDGTGSVTTTVDATLREGQRYHVNVHRSAADMSVIACGDLDND